MDGHTAAVQSYYPVLIAVIEIKVLVKDIFGKVIDYERIVNSNIDEYEDVIALCAYPRNRLSLDDIFQVSSNHHFSFTYSKEIVEYF